MHSIPGCGYFPLFLLRILAPGRSKGTWCSWLSRSLSTSLDSLREGSGSIPDVSIFFCPFLHVHSPRVCNLAAEGMVSVLCVPIPRPGSRARARGVIGVT